MKQRMFGSSRRALRRRAEAAPVARVSLAAVLAAAMLVICIPPVGARGAATPGSAGIGDSYFPLAGNGGYDVGHYALDIRYAPHTDRLVGAATITVQATQALSRFNMDFVGLRVRSVTVDGAGATWEREQHHELVITPATALADGATFVVVARYAGVPKSFVVPGTTIHTGVVSTDDGALIWGEPDVAAAWFPVNDHPRDKATYRIDLTVPDGLEAISNGRFIGRIDHPQGGTTWSWNETSPMASYLAMAAIGRFDTQRYRLADGTPVFDAIDSRVHNAAKRALRQQPRILRFLRREFGPYPFDAVGAVVERHPLGHAALETQTRPIYDARLFAGDANTYVIVHELAHQWYGDSVSLDRWKHVWLNEGFATYAEWLWNQELGRNGPQQIASGFCAIPADSAFWMVKVGDPGVARLFHGAVYLRGAMTLQALRKAVGSGAFFHIVRRWAVVRRDMTGTTAQFIRLAERISGLQLESLFEEWLYVRGRPRPCVADGSGSRRSP
jgi:aminopeptidase N